jgi:hypothetical protein
MSRGEECDLMKALADSAEEAKVASPLQGYFTSALSVKMQHPSRCHYPPLRFTTRRPCMFEKATFLSQLIIHLMHVV